MGKRARPLRRWLLLAGGLSVLFLVFLCAGVLSVSSPAYGGPETMGQSPEAKSGVRAPRDIPLGVEEEMEEDIGKPDDDADVVEMATNESYLPTGRGEVWSSAPEAAALRQRSGFDAFNARYQNKWAATFSKETGRVTVLYGAVSRPYKNGPEETARGFLKDTAALFGLKPDLSDLATKRVDRTPERDHVRLQRIYNGVPIEGVLVLVHATPQGQVTMVQNSYREGFKTANSQVVAAEAATETAHSDLLASLGKAAILAEPKAEQRIAPYNGEYYYIWRVAISTDNPFGFWVYHVDAENGEILYKADEILSGVGPPPVTTGKGRAYKSNADWHKGKISSVSLKNIYTAAECPYYCGGYLNGVHALIVDHDLNGHDPYAPDNKFLYDPVTQKNWFDEAHAYYQLNTVWDWWNTKVLKKYGPAYCDYFYHFSIPAVVNCEDPTCICDAFYDPGIHGFRFGDENSCATGSEDLVIDNDIVRHEYTHGMMDRSGFDAQFGGAVDNYGRAMGEGNADWFAFLNTPKDPLIGDVAFALAPGGYLRNLDNTRMYPYDVDDPDYGVPEEHYTGEIWGGYLYDLYRVLKSKALPYVYNAFYYFVPAGGRRDGLPDFVDAIVAQGAAELDLTGKLTSHIKTWGSKASRGLNMYFQSPPYSHSTNYFGTGMAGSDNAVLLAWPFPPYRSLKTKGNILNNLHRDEYPIDVTAAGLDLTVTVKGKAGGARWPSIQLFTSGGVLQANSHGATLTKAVLTYPDLPVGQYIIVIDAKTSTSVPARGYYDLSLTLK